MKKLAIVGATGLVGQTVLKILNEEDLLDRFELFMLVSEKSAGKQIRFCDKYYPLIKLDEKVLKFGFDYAVFLTDEQVSMEWVKRFAQKGVIVIDNSSAFRLDVNTPLIVPEINFDKISVADNVISNPNCSTIQLVIVLDRLSKVGKIKKVVVSSYQSVSGAGREALQDLQNSSNNYFEKGIKDNIIAKIGSPHSNGNYSEEDKIILESQKILQREFEIYATAVRVPISFCHGESVYVEFEENIEMCNLQNSLCCDYIRCSDDLFYPTDCKGSNLTYVFRVRKAGSNSILLFILADNLRRGAAYNAVRILEKLEKMD